MGRREGGERVLFHAGDFLALEAALWRELDSVRERAPLAPVVVLVPTNLLRRHLAAAGARRGGILNVHLLTLLDLARKLEEPALGCEGRTALPGLGAELVARHAARIVAPESFAAIAGRPGFHRALLATVADLKEAGHAPAELRAALASPRWQGSALLPRMRDLAALWEAYEARLKELGLYDTADLMAAAAAAAAGDAWLGRAAAVFVYGFYDLNELQRRLVAASVAGRQARAFFPYVPGARAFRYAKSTFEWFAAQGFRPRDEGEGSPAGELAAWRQRLFEKPSGSPLLPGRLRIVSAPDEVREAREVIRAVVDSARQGAALPRVGVLLRQGATYARLFAEECQVGGLDAYLHSPPPLAATRAGRSFGLLVSLACGSTPEGGEPEFCRSDVMDFVTYADLAVAGEPNVADWEVFSIEAGVVKGRENWTRRLTALRKRLEEDRADWDDEEDGEGGDEASRAEKRAALDAFAAFIGQLLAAVEEVPRSGSWAEVVDGLLGLYRRFVRPSDERAAVVEAVGGLRALDACGEPADLASVARLAREELEAALPPRPAFGSCGPAVVDLLEARGLVFDVVCIPGLVEKGFPALAAPDPLLSDGERERLNESGLRLPLKGRRVEEEELLFRLAAGAGTERVLLSYPRMEPASGRERQPSHFLLRAVEALTGRRADYKALAEFPGVERISASACAPPRPEAAWRAAEYDLAAVRGILAGAAGAAEAAYLGSLSETFLPAWRAEARRWEEPRFTSHDGVLADPAALAALAERLGPPPWRTSASQLEEYAACPFKFFLRRILRLEPLKEPESVRRIAGLDRGVVMHRILASALRRARDERRLPLQKGDAERVLEAARAEFDAFETHGLVGAPALWQLDKEALELDLHRFVEAEADDDSGFLPAHFEAAFGYPTPREGQELWNPKGVLLDLGDGGSMLLRGRIDRIDLTPDGARARVLDYKTGKVGARDDCFAGGTTLQLPIYLCAAEALLANVAATLAAYRHVTEAGGYKTVQFTREALERHWDRFREILLTIAEGVRSGRFFAGMPSGGEDGACKWCDFRPVCRSAAVAASRAKSRDPAAERFICMRGIE